MYSGVLGGCAVIGPPAFLSQVKSLVANQLQPSKAITNDDVQHVLQLYKYVKDTSNRAMAIDTVDCSSFVAAIVLLRTFMERNMELMSLLTALMMVNF